MSKIAFLQNNYLKTSIVFLFALSYPVYFTFFSNERIFYLILLLLLLIIILAGLIIFDYSLYKKNFNNIMDWLYYRLTIPWFQLIVLYFIILLFLEFLNNTILNNYLPLIIFFCWLLPILTVITVSRNIYSLIVKIREMANNGNLFGLGIISLSIITLVVVFFVPDFAFAFGYNIFLATFENIKLEMLDTYYLSLVISNTLPVGEPYINYITTIGQNTYIYIFQTVHVFSNKIINWVVIGVVFNYIFLAIDSSRRN